MKKTKTYYKQSSLTAVKGAGVTPEMLDIINSKYAQAELTADDVYVQGYIQAHNGIDRDRERFTEDLLDDYARTMPGKSFLEVHDKRKLPVGLYFDAKTKEITKEEFKAMTGEDIRLPDGVDRAKVVLSWIYTLTKEWNQKLIDNLKAGIYRHTSIGFSASDLKPVKGEHEQILYYEYVAPGESREGSIVYLGAQQGATVQKDPDIQDYKAATEQQTGNKTQTLNSWLKTQDKSNSTNGSGILPAENDKEGGKEMDELKKLIAEMSKSFNRHIDENNIVAEVKAIRDEAVKAAETKMSEKDTEIDGLNTKIKDFEAQIADLTPLVEEGKAYRSGLVDDCIKMKAKLGDIGEKEEEQKGVRDVVEKYPIDYLKGENEILTKRVAEKFPADPQTKGDTSRDKSEGKGDKNPLIPKTDKQ